MTGGARPLLFASAETAAAIADAHAVAVLVGSYDGSGNFGDVAQLDATLELLEPLDGDLLVLPVLERSRFRDHAGEVGGRMLRSPSNPLFMGPGGAEEGDQLVAVTAPEGLEFAACLLYGGGYLNRLWGRRKLDMLAAAEGLVESARCVRRLGCGLQAEREWLAGLAAGDRRALASFELLGSRDRRSGSALAEQLAPATIFESGDDAVGLLAKARAVAEPAAEDELRVNLHFGEHEFFSPEPDAVRDFVVAFLAALGREAGRTICALPLIAYVDRHIDERPGLERLTAACEAAGIAVEEPLLLAPTTIAETGPEIARASLTLSCSYHVALTSLMSGVPIVGMRENEYYGQKVEGLLESFGLPQDLAVDSACEAVACARRVAAIVLEGSRPGPASGAAGGSGGAGSTAAADREQAAWQAVALGPKP